MGGIETVSALLAPEFIKAGHEVILVTKTKEEDGITRPYRVCRNPNPLELIRLLRWSDIFLQSNISLRLAWPLVLVRRPWVIVHQTWIRSPGGPWTWHGALKHFLMRFSFNISISGAVAKALPLHSLVIGNPYSDDIFHERRDIVQSRDLAYLGRLVSDKGVDSLVEALAHLRKRGLTPSLTIIGSGPEQENLQKLAEDIGVTQQISFTGTKSGQELACLLSEHYVLVVPSRLPEPFGIVALEGIASGCVIIASQEGGLPEVIGPCGITFQNGSPASLSEALFQVLSQPDLRKQLRRNAKSHLSQFTLNTIATKYLEVLIRTAQRR